jgi:glycosyltransferase involved in cell wall biosynthesis
MNVSQPCRGEPADAIHALWLVRENLRTHPGGDTTQVLQTAAALERRGVAIELASRLPESLQGRQIVHLFHLDRLWEHLGICRRLRAAGVPTVLSTIYWPTDEFDQRGRAGVQGILARRLGSQPYQTLRLMQRFGLHALKGRTLRGWDRRLLSFKRAARYLLETVAVVLPNSSAELREIEQRFGIWRPAVVVPNAVDLSTFARPADAQPDERVGVLCVGRIEPRKNQLAVIKALRATDIPLTLVGRPGRFNDCYWRQCQAAAGRRTRFLGQRGPAELATLYWSARVHACVSWYETPGLASLEAAAAGCNLVVTPGGCTREYFGDQAWYCRPDDPRSIRAAVERALAAELDADLARRVARKFNWDVAAENTLRGYKLAVQSRPR